MDFDKAYEPGHEEAVLSDLTYLYGHDHTRIERERLRYQHLASAFEATFQTHDQLRFFSTPGRSEISGNHTDHQHGRVLVASIDLDTIAAVRQHSEPYVRFFSEGYGMTQISILDLEPQTSEEGTTAALIRGVLRGMKDKGLQIGGFDAYCTSLVPAGSGLSSSAAFEVLVCGILDRLYNEGTLPPLEQAKICQYAENVFFGKPSGLLDQCGCAVGGFAYLDFKDPANPELEKIEFDFEESGLQIVVTQTGGDHSDLTHCYAAIPEEMLSVAKQFGQTHLRDVDAEAFYLALPSLRNELPERSLLRAMHFWNEDHRVQEQRIALHARDMETFLDLVNESGLSSQLLLQNIYNDTDATNQPLSLALALSERLLKKHGGAWRIHGGGFAGTIQAFVPSDYVDAYCQSMDAIFGQDHAVVLQIRPVGTYELFCQRTSDHLS